MPENLNVVYVSFEEAQKLLSIFHHLAKYGQWVELRRQARTIIEKLRVVRSIDYALGGDQLFLTEKEYEFFLDVRGALAMEDREV